MRALKVASLTTTLLAVFMLPATACDYSEQHAATPADKPVAAAPAAAQAGTPATAIAAAPTTAPAVTAPTQTADTAALLPPATSKPN